ncbi:MAG TPA: RNA polymerase sigma factor [Candidatus Saccharimonadales bacterium]|nr:RNA polymerase sigma factor [Candidatus Saccharimonadales bacterium]
MIFDESNRGGSNLADTNRLAQAIEAAQRGEAHGWSALFERFYPDVHAYALARLGDLTAAEDVTQDVFVAAVTSIKTLRDRREPAVQAWFLHICRYKAVDHIRRASRQRGLSLDAGPADADPGALAEMNIEADRVRAAMVHLTEDQRDILVRRFVLDQSLEEVASTTRRTIGAVKSMQHRALESVRRALRPRRAA